MDTGRNVWLTVVVWWQVSVLASHAHAKAYLYCIQSINCSHELTQWLTQNYGWWSMLYDLSNLWRTY